MDDPSTDDPDERLAATAVTLVTFVAAFGGLALDVPFWWVAFPVGFGGVLPLAVALVRRRREGRERTTGPTGRNDALDELRSRYARGEIDEAEFERRVEGLLETETDADAAAYARRGARDRTEPAAEAGTDRQR